MWRWLVIQVAIPLIGPVALSALFAFAWSTGQPGFSPDPRIILDITPTALTFYSLALLSITLAGFWQHMSTNALVGTAALIVGCLVAVYYSFTVVWRHAEDYVPTAETFYVTVVLTVVTIVIAAVLERRRQA
jgi:drug/metabolite transporter (DMT)-like permease